MDPYNRVRIADKNHKLKTEIQSICEKPIVRSIHYMQYQFHK